MRPRCRLGRNVIAAAAASTALLCSACSPARIASAPAAHGAAKSAAHRRAPAKAAVVPACNPAASLRPPAGPPTVTPGSFMATIRKRGYLKVGVSLNTYHMGYLNPSDGQIEGFDIDMLHAISVAIFGKPNQIHYVGITDDQRMPFVQAGRVDIVARTMTILSSRWLRVDFSTVYLEAHQRILVEDGSRIQGVTDLAGLKVCATFSSTSLAYLQKHGAVPVLAYDWSDCLVKLQQGQVAAISTDNVILAGLQAQDPYTKIVGPNLTDEPYGLAISKQHPDFVRFVNGVLAQMRANGLWAASYRRWIGSPAPAPPPAQYQT